MGEALIIRSGGNSQSGGGYTQKTEVININQTWKVPKAKNQEFMVRIFGGGGGANYSQMMAGTGGGGGNMNNSVFKLNEGDLIPITIGDAGSDRSTSSSGTNGGTTSFGTYLSATGGEVGSSINGGNGGTGGGVGAYVAQQTAQRNMCAGCGSYGGGGGGYSGYNNTGTYRYIIRTKGGNGGIYGGGGSFAEGISLGGYGNGATCNFSNTGSGSLQDSENGMNTINLVTKIDYVGKGLKGSSYGGGGGYGGNGGNSYIHNEYWYTGGGGGGYGGNGGDATLRGGGGGGGYGNDGADSRNITSPSEAYSGGGGGGYGPEGYGHGSGGIYKSGTLCTAKSGVCIISYLEPVQ